MSSRHAYHDGRTGLLLAFLAPIAHTGHFGIQMMGLLDGNRLNRRLVRCYDGFFVQVLFFASPYLWSELYQSAPLVACTLHTVEDPQPFGSSRHVCSSSYELA